MSRNRKVLGSVLAFLILLCGPTEWAAAPAPDKVLLRDGSEIPCRLISVDDRQVLIERGNGDQSRFDRKDVRRIEFGEVEVPRIVARVRVFDGDDQLRLILDGLEVAKPDVLRTGWVDLAPLLKDGANLLTAEVLNEKGTWSYRWVLEAGTAREVFACGLPGKTGCTQDGFIGRETGTLPAGKVWIFVHRSSGEIRVQRE